MTFIFPRSYLSGLTLSTAGSSATFGVAAGQATDSTNVAIMNFAAAFTKTTASWSAGSGNGALDTGTIVPSTWYHIHLISDALAQTVDILISLSATSPTMPTGFTLFRRIGSMLTNASSRWVGFTQVGDDVLWTNPFGDVEVTNQSTTFINYTLTVPPGTPVIAKIRGSFTNATVGTSILFASPDEGASLTASPVGNLDASVQIASVGVGFGAQQVRTSNGQIKVVASVAGTIVHAVTYGYSDARGKSG